MLPTSVYVFVNECRWNKSQWWRCELGWFIIIMYDAYCNAWCGLCIGSVFNVFVFYHHCRTFFSFYLRIFFLSVCWVIRCFGLGVRDAKSFRMGIRPLVINRLYLRKMSWIKIDEPPASNWFSLPWERAHYNASKLTYFGFRLTLRWLIGMHCCVLHVTITLRTLNCNIFCKKKEGDWCVLRTRAWVRGNKDTWWTEFRVLIMGFFRFNRKRAMWTLTQQLSTNWGHFCERPSTTTTLFNWQYYYTFFFT